MGLLSAGQRVEIDVYGRGKEGVLSHKAELSFDAETMLWLEPSHGPRFFPFREGPRPSLSKSFHCAICWIVIYNAAATEKYTADAEPWWLDSFSMASWDATIV